METIVTGLTNNYISYWTEKQALKEAAQNITWGAVKEQKVPTIQYDESTGTGIMEDSFTGFAKQFLYIGESEQRQDEQGLGTFGEGWKIFLLVMARNNRYHRVETVGFTFWGEMEETPHGPKVLVIRVEDNDRATGTKVIAECNQEDFNESVECFAYIQGISIERNKVIQDRYHELWVNGVKVEQDENKNPLELKFAYNLENTDIVNRDRSQVNSSTAYEVIRSIVARADVEFIKEYIKASFDSETDYQDILRGPSFDSSNGEQTNNWKQAIEEVHGAEFKKLLLPSSSVELNKEAEYRGYKMLKFPSQWAFELGWIGFKKVADIVTHRLEKKEIEIYDKEKEVLRIARLDVKKALGLKTVSNLPAIIVVDTIKSGDGVTTADGMYERDIKTIYIARHVLERQYRATEVLLHESIHWKTGAGDNTERFTNGYSESILRLLKYELED